MCLRTFFIWCSYLWDFNEAIWMRFGVIIKEWSILQTLTLTGRSTGYYWMHCDMWRPASLCQHPLEMMASALVLCKSGFFFPSIACQWWILQYSPCTLSRLSGPKDYVSQGALTHNYLSGCGCGCHQSTLCLLIPQNRTEEIKVQPSTT